jgi:hypothetical protein
MNPETPNCLLERMAATSRRHRSAVGWRVEQWVHYWKCWTAITAEKTPNRSKLSTFKLFSVSIPYSELRLRLSLTFLDPVITCAFGGCTQNLKSFRKPRFPLIIRISVLLLDRLLMRGGPADS